MLNFHPHLHCIVTGGALSVDGQRWRAPKQAKFLFPIRAVGACFRGKFLAGVQELLAAEPREGKPRLVLPEELLAMSPGERQTWWNQLYKMKWAVLRQPKDDGSFERRDHTIPIRRDGKSLWVRHETQDIAVLRLADPLPIAITALPASVIADATQLKAAGVHLCSPLFVLTYPQRFEANGAGFPVARQGIFASPPLLPAQTHPTFLADFTTFAGDSGGPVFMAGADGHPLLVGIVLAQFHHDERVTCEYEERTIHHPLGLGTIVHAQYVRDTLEATAKQNAPTSK